MAVTVNPLPGGNKAKRWEVIFGADGDTTVDLDHGMNGAPDHVEILYTTPEAIVPGAVTRGTVDADKITINKLNAVGSAGATVEVVAWLPNGSF
jgi:hypothetical protein